MRSICLCQGGFGLLGGGDDEARARAHRPRAEPGGRLAVTAFTRTSRSAIEAGDTFDAFTGVNHERATAS